MTEIKNIPVAEAHRKILLLADHIQRTMPGHMCKRMVDTENGEETIILYNEVTDECLSINIRSKFTETFLHKGKEVINEFRN